MEVYKEWDDRFDADGTVNKYSINKIEVEEGYNMNGTLGDPNLTELYIEKELFISIHRLVKNPEGGYDRRRRHNKSNTKSRKHRNGYMSRFKLGI